MAVNHGGVTHIPQSLPSFAQAFSAPPFGSISSGNNSLPPIHTRPISMENRRVHSPSLQTRSRPSSEESPSIAVAGRKRPRTSFSGTRDDEASDSDPSRHSPHAVHVKEEDHDMLEPSPPPPPRVMEPRVSQDCAGAPPPSSLHPPSSKKRRVTISGAPHPGPLNTDVRVPADQPSSTPISPVVMGFTIMRDNPTAIEQVRSMITVKQKQKALIEQRRGSVAAMSPVAGNTIASALEGTVATAKPPASARPLRRSPNSGSGSASARRPPSTAVQGGVNPRPPSPSPIIVPSQQPMQVPSQAPAHPLPAHSLPPPPISFARRRAGQLGPGRKKPADIVISPREAHTQEQLQPVIQSAPPIPQGQGAFYTGRFPMALPRLPPAITGGDNVRRVATGNVPPTPTRLSMQRNAPAASHVSAPLPGISGRSPPAASVPIASTLVPPTPSSLQHPGYTGDKSAFLAPFEVFYDALDDSKQLKNWLGEQMQRSNALLQSLTQQQEKLNEVVDGLVEKKVAGMRMEVTSLHRRVEELEEALRVATFPRRQSTDILVGGKTKGKQPLRNGIPTAAPLAPETYTFPPVEPSPRMKPEHVRRISSPGWGQDRETRENQSVPENEQGSPVPYDSRRLSLSATRLDPQRSQPGDGPSPQQRNSFVVQSPPQGFRDGPGHSLPPLNTGKLPRSSHSERPQQQPQHSHPRPPAPPRYHSDEGKPSGERGSPPPRRADSRRNSVVMSPPVDGHGTVIDGS